MFIVKAIVEDSILIGTDLGNPDQMRRMFMVETGVCHACGRGVNKVALAKEIGVSRFVIERLLTGQSTPRTVNYLKIARWIFERRSSRARK